MGRLESDPDTVALVYSDRIDEIGRGMAARRLGIKINVDRMPTREELTDLARSEGLSVIYIEAS